MGLVQGESMAARFFHRLGASLLDRTICASAGGEALATRPRRARSACDVEHFADSRLILIWGSNAITSNLHFWTRAQEAKRARREADRDRSVPHRRPPRSATSTSRCCPAPTPRWRSA